MASFRSAIWLLFGAFLLLLTFASPLTVILLPAFLGGLIVAGVVFLLSRRARQRGRMPPEHLADPFGDVTNSTDVINFSRIRVAGFGGLGFVIVAFVVALEVERIGQVIMIGAAGGAIAALALIFWRRRRGPISTSSQSPGANAMLRLDDDTMPPPAAPAPRRGPSHRAAPLPMQPRV